MIYPVGYNPPPAASAMQHTPPVVSVMHEISARANLRNYDALDVFAGEGKELKKWIRFVNNVHCWELEPEKALKCKEAVPRARVEPLDSYLMAPLASVNPNRYGLIMIDNDMLRTDHVEHFDLFPHIFNWLDMSLSTAYMVMNVIDDPHPYYVSGDRDKAHSVIKCGLERIRFYRSSTDSVPWTTIIGKYKSMASDMGLHISWDHLEKRSRQGVHYLALEVKK